MALRDGRNALSAAQPNIEEYRVDQQNYTPGIIIMIFCLGVGITCNRFFRSKILVDHPVPTHSRNNEASENRCLEGMVSGNGSLAHPPTWQMPDARNPEQSLESGFLPLVFSRSLKCLWMKSTKILEEIVISHALFHGLSVSRDIGIGLACRGTPCTHGDWTPTNFAGSHGLMCETLSSTRYGYDFHCHVVKPWT